MVNQNNGLSRSLGTIAVESVGGVLWNGTCAAVKNRDTPDGAFWGSTAWETHKIGWLVSGIFTLITCAISGYSVWTHARNYRKPLEQRQIIRCLLISPVFAITSWIGFRFVRYYIYFQLIRDMYEAFCIAAFCALMLMYLAQTPAQERHLNAQHDKRRLVFPLCCWRFKPWKASFIVTVKWLVMQFVVVKPLISVLAIVTEAFGKYCRGSYSFRFSSIYYQIFDFVSVGVAIYGLVLLYACVKEDLIGKKPLAKFMTIKTIVFLVFYQDFVFEGLIEGGIIRPTQYWTTTNISDALSAFATTFEMIIIALWSSHAFPAAEYSDIEDARPTSAIRSLLHSQNYLDFVLDTYFSTKYLVDRLAGKSYTRSNEALRVEQALYVGAGGNNFDFEQAFQPLAQTDGPGKPGGEGDGHSLSASEVEEGAPPEWLEQSGENDRILGSKSGGSGSGGQGSPRSYGTMNQDELEEAERRRLQALELHGTDAFVA